MWMREIPRAVVGRLPRYYRYLGELMAKRVERVSSNDLAELMDSTGSQVRQDFNMFGGFGQQGYGYNVQNLHEEIGNIIGLNQKHNIIVIGAGNLGQALINYGNFTRYGFVMKGMFDVNPRLFGLTIRGIEIQPIDNLEQFIRENDIQIAALTLPKTQAPEIADRLVAAGIKAIWNFAHTDLKVPRDVIVENVHLSESLMRLSFQIQQAEQERNSKNRMKTLNAAS